MSHRSVRLWIAMWAALGSSNAALAASFPVTGTLSIEIAGVAVVTTSGSGTALVNGSGGAGHLDTLALPANVFQSTGVVIAVTDPAASPIKGLQVTIANAAGTITSGAGAIPLAGFAKVCIFGASCASVAANLSVPLSVVGAGGFASATAAVDVTVFGAPWTTATAAHGTVTRMGFAKGPASNPSSTGIASGELQLVTPIFISTTSPVVVIPIFAAMTLHFVPEPGTIALLGAGLALLAAGGERLRNR